MNSYCDVPVLQQTRKSESAILTQSGFDIPSSGPLHTNAVQNPLSGLTGLSQDQKPVPKTQKSKDVFPYSEGLLIEVLNRTAHKILLGNFPELS